MGACHGNWVVVVLFFVKTKSWGNFAVMGDGVCVSGLVWLGRWTAWLELGTWVNEIHTLACSASALMSFSSADTNIMLVCGKVAKQKSPLLCCKKIKE